jgi:hypothetical protein
MIIPVMHRTIVRINIWKTMKLDPSLISHYTVDHVYNLRLSTPEVQLC